MLSIRCGFFLIVLFFTIQHTAYAVAGSAPPDTDLSFDIDAFYYEDQYRKFDVDFSSGTEEDYGNLNLTGTWTSKDVNADHDPGLQFCPSNGDSEIFDIDTTNDVYQVVLPKPLNGLPDITASNTIDWSDEPYYIYEGSAVDFRSSNAAIASSENVEWIKLAFDANRENLKIYLEITDDNDIEDVGFRFVILPDHLRGNWNDIAYMDEMYPPGSIIFDVHTITADSADVVKLKVDSNQDAALLNDPGDWVQRNGENLLINLSIMEDEPDFFDISEEDFILECISFNFEDKNPDNLNWSKRADFLSPRFLDSRAGGEFTATSMDFDGQSAVSTDWIFATRLRNFNAFSADRINEFKIGMYNNNVGGYNDAPQASISGKWVKGFYNGKKYKKAFLFECRVFDNENSVDGEWLTEDAVEVAGIAPQTAVIDMAMETAENGMKLKFYYRISTDGDEPAEISAIDSTWTLFNTFEVTSARPFYGYQVNKGVVFIRSDALAFPVSLPNWGNSGKNCRIRSTETTSKSTNDLFDLHGLADFLPMAPAQAAAIDVNSREKVVLRYMIRGTRKQIAKLGLMKLKTGNTLPFGNYLTEPDPADLISGSWWLTEHGEDPDEVLEKSEYLDKDTTYCLYFVVKDNDGKYDLDDTLGVILDPTVIGDSTAASIIGEESSSGGGSSGGSCFIQSMAWQSHDDAEGSIYDKFKKWFIYLID